MLLLLCSTRAGEKPSLLLFSQLFLTRCRVPGLFCVSLRLFLVKESSVVASGLERSLGGERLLSMSLCRRALQVSETEVAVVVSHPWVSFSDSAPRKRERRGGTQSLGLSLGARQPCPALGRPPSPPAIPLLAGSSWRRPRRRAGWASYRTASAGAVSAV